MVKPETYDVVALVSNDLVTDQRMHKSLATLQDAGLNCLLLGREKATSPALPRHFSFATERHKLSAEKGKLFYWQLNRAHYKRLLTLRPRAILVVDLDTMWAGARAARKLGIPWVYDAHELFTETPEVYRRPLIKATWTWLAKRYIPQATACYTVGSAIAAEFERRYQRSFSVVKNFPQRYPKNATPKVPPAVQELIDQSTSSDSTAPFRVLYQGALNVGRGVEQLVDAARRLPEVEFWIAGSGDLEEDLRSRAHHLRNVVFFGQLHPEALRGLTGQASLGYALMENRGLNYYLSLSNKSVDYIHAGLPSLQMAWPEYVEINKSYGCYHLVDELSTESVIAAIEKCLSPTHYEFLQVGTQAARLQLTWQSQAEKLLEIFTSLLEI